MDVGGTRSSLTCVSSRHRIGEAARVATGLTCASSRHVCKKWYGEKGDQSISHLHELPALGELRRSEETLHLRLRWRPSSRPAACDAISSAWFIWCFFDAVPPARSVSPV
jgi:hypothetical protein